ncbi:MAG: metal ABC transporter permease [Defluviicoccus sp.]|nr:metal ABC transporter permease [Defluviicoccus sp.]MDE0386526.1 metal ABC transporter permease [Defluviicoccus sp.]
MERIRLLLLFLIAEAIAAGMKIVGMLPAAALAIVPAAAARRLVATPERMAAAAIAIGVVSVVAGPFGSLRWDVPAGPAIVPVTGAMFAAGPLVPVPRGPASRG